MDAGLPEPRHPGAPNGVTFTAADLAAISRFTHDQAEMLLADFADEGVLEAAGQGYTFTPEGHRIAALLRMVMP